MHIFVTGAAGLIGGEVCARLADAEHRVTALVRSNPDVLANDGTPAAVAEVLTGDLSQDGMGLDPAVLERLAGKIDLVLHCAALTRFDLDEDAYRATNIDGTARALDLARQAGAGFLHVSTAYVCGDRSGPIGEDDPLPTGGFTNGYEASKAEAEALVRASGVPFVIARPSIVVGDSRTGAIRQFDTIYAAFKLIAEGRVRHMPVSKGATLDFVSLDHVAAGIVALVERFDAAQGGTYHLVSGGPVPVEDFAAAIGSFDHFSAPVLADAAGFDSNMLHPLERRLYKRVAALYAAYFQRDPRFGDARLRAVTGLEPPVMDQAMLRKLISYCIDVGFLNAPELQRTSG
ncbi:SDR family oxidoreductase [Parerythrobacter aurantius]|uniref:SDR family oxidoreductase n=1 Tax=Parerythrobacter aurantius TaxID=3127706 RepID=UPI003255A78F